jgi:hypothetical protein
VADRDEAFWLNLEHRLEQIEKDAEGDHETIRELSKKLEQLQSNFEEYREVSRKTDRLLMWFTDMVKRLRFAVFILTTSRLSNAK